MKGMLTLKQAASVIGIDVQACRRRLKATDEQLRARGEPTILVRFGKGRNAPFYVSLDALKRAFPGSTGEERQDNSADVSAIRQDVAVIAAAVAAIQARTEQIAALIERHRRSQ